MYHLHIAAVGKTKEAWLEEACQEYMKRLSKKMQITCTWYKTDAQLTAALTKEKMVICLDPAGKLMNSEQFSDYLVKALETGGSHLTLAIGGPDGLPQEVLSHYPRVSLSPLTMTHQIVRVVLFEQLYRAMEIASGSPYHK